MSQPPFKVEHLNTVDPSAPKPKEGDTVTIHYVGTLLNGTKFDSSRDRGKPFQTVIGKGKVIKGWDEGIPQVPLGGKARLTIPSDMAYGKEGLL
ncbi:peptidyl-prolyl cis-trans isomerase, FKBP-type protein, partial [Rhizoctonia solani AG-3 Rhs1AP]